MLTQQEQYEMNEQFGRIHTVVREAVEAQRVVNTANSEWADAGYPVRTNVTGATRDSAEGKNEYEGFLSPLVLEAYGDYMTEHRKQSDGSLRASDNWQKGMPLQWYRDSLIRHVFIVWKLWRGWPAKPEKIGGVLRQPTLIEALNGILFNTMGMMHELLKIELEKEITRAS